MHFMQQRVDRPGESQGGDGRKKSRDWSSLELRLQLLLLGGTMKGVGSCKSSLASFVFLFGLLSGH